jgi:tetratricopeptide (TPR) repeat protein
MEKVARNAPCPCGSGKKYKKCCLAHDQAHRWEARSQASPLPGLHPSQGRGYPDIIETDLDALSNRALDLIKEGNFEPAEEACRELLDQYPDQVDGLMRLGQLYKARGEGPKAVDHLRQAAEFMRARPDWYDTELVQSMQDEADALASSLMAHEAKGGTNAT